MKDTSQHENLSRDHKIETGSDRSFGIVFAVVFAIIGLWPVVFSGSSPRWWAMVIAAVFALIAIFKPSLLARANILWAGLGILIGKFVTPIVMVILFFVTVTPVGLLMRVFKKDPLNIRFDPQATSYWIERDPPGPDAESMRNQF